MADFLAGLVLSRLVKLRDCLFAIRAHKGVARYASLIDTLQKHVISQLYEQLALLDVDHWCPLDLKKDLDLGLMSVVVLIKYVDYFAIDQKPSTKVRIRTSRWSKHPDFVKGDH